MSTEIIKMTDPPKVILDALLNDYAIHGPYLYSCDRIMSSNIMDKIVKAGDSYSGVSFRQVPKGILVYKLDTDTMCLVETIRQTPQGVQLVPRCTHISEVVK